MITCTFEKGFTAHLRHVVVHAICVKGNSIVLVKRAEGIVEPGKWAIPGGFLDMNESGSEGVLREFTEETGYGGKVKACFRVFTRPRIQGTDRQDVAIDYLIESKKRVKKTEWDSVDVRWFALTKLPGKKTIAFDHWEIIQQYLKYRENPFPLPLVV